MRLFGYEFGIIRESDTKDKYGVGLIAPRTSLIQTDVADDMPQNIQLQQKYKNAYDNFPIVQASADLIENFVVQDFYFKGPKEGKANKLIGELNLKTHFRRVVKCVIKHGNCWVEQIKEGNGIPKQKILDPLSMHTIRTPEGKVIGQVQIVGNKALLWGELYKSQKSFYNKQVENVGEVEDIIHYRINVQGSEKYGTPLAHSALTMLDIKDQLESDLKVMIKRYIAPIIHAQVGDDTKPATQGEVDTVSNGLRDIYADTEYVTDHRVKMNVLGFNNKGINPDPIIKHVDMQIMMAMHVPPVLLGYGGGQDRAVAEVNLRTFAVYIKSLREEINTQFKDEFIIGQGIGGEDLEIVWGHVDKREEIDEITQIINVLKAGLLTPQKANDLLPEKYHEKLPEFTNPMEQPTLDGKNPLDNPNDPTKSTELVKGRRVNKTDVKSHLDEDVSKRREANA